MQAGMRDKTRQPSTSLPRPTAVTPKGQPRTPGSSRKPAASKVDIAPKDRRHTTITPDVAGTYVLEIVYTVGDTKVSDTVTLQATEDNLPPIAMLKSKSRQLVGGTVELNGGRSYDLAGDALTYSWKLLSAPKDSQDHGLFKHSDQATKSTSLEGADYYWFFTFMMLITAVLFVPCAHLPATDLHPRRGRRSLI